MEADFKVIGYFSNWATYRPGKGSFTPSNIDPSLCTHIIYAFATLNAETYQLQSSDSWVDIDKHFYEMVTSLKSANLKVLLAIGGWNDSAGNKYSQLVSDPKRRQGFIAHAVEFLKKFNFDGLDLDWEYPARPQGSHGNPLDKDNFAIFVQELHFAFQKQSPPLILSAAVAASKDIAKDAYDIPALSKYLDFFNVMCYDYHGSWDQQTGPVAPFKPYPGSDPNLTVESTMDYYVNGGAPKGKLVMGVPAYGRSFTLTNPGNHGLNAPTTGPGQAGEFTRESGMLAYYEISEKIEREGWTKVNDSSLTSGPYAFKGNQWVGFDDPTMVTAKATYAQEQKFGGCMLWDLCLDDFRANPSFPILRAINNSIDLYRVRV